MTDINEELKNLLRLRGDSMSCYAADRLEALEQKAESLEDAVKALVALTTETDAVLCGEISSEWADSYGPLWEKFAAATTVLAKAAALGVKGEGQ